MHPIIMGTAGGKDPIGDNQYSNALMFADFTGKTGGNHVDYKWPVGNSIVYDKTGIFDGFGLYEPTALQTSPKVLFRSTSWLEWLDIGSYNHDIIIDIKTYKTDSVYYPGMHIHRTPDGTTDFAGISYYYSNRGTPVRIDTGLYNDAGTPYLSFRPYYSGGTIAFGYNYLTLKLNFLAGSILRHTLELNYSESFYYDSPATTHKRFRIGNGGIVGNSNQHIVGIGVWRAADYPTNGLSNYL